MVAKLDGLDEYDRRRPVTPSGTNLLGLVKHLAGVEHTYLGESVGRPPPQPADRRDTTLGVLLIRVVAETAQHAGHADIVREVVDGVGAPDHDDVADEATWRAYVARIEAAAGHFRSPR